MSAKSVSNEFTGTEATQLTKAVGILNPVHSVGCLWGCGIDIYVVENDVGSVHHVDSPELRLYDIESSNVNIADVPKHEGHWAAWTGRSYESTFGLVSLVPVPYLAVTIDATRTVAVDAYVVASQYESGCMILKLDVIVVVPPVFEIFRELEAERVSVLMASCIRLGLGSVDLLATLLSNQLKHR